MTSNHKRFLAVAANLLATVFIVASVINLAGCDRSQVARFRLNVDTWVGYAPFWLAKDKGFLESEGIDLEIVTMPDVGQRKAAIIRGDSDAIAETVDMLVLDRGERVPSIAVMELDVSNGADGILSTDRIRTVEDLKGQRVAVQRNYASEALLNYVLIKHGLHPSDITKLDMEGGAAGAAFVGGQVDVAVTFEPWLSKARERRAGKVLISSADVPGVIVDILSVREQYLRSHPGTVQQVMRAWFKAVDYWRTNPRDANAIMAKHYNSQPAEFGHLIEGLIWPAYPQNRQYFGVGQSTAPILDVADTFRTIFQETGQLTASPDIKPGINTALLGNLYVKK